MWELCCDDLIKQELLRYVELPIQGHLNVKCLQFSCVPQHLHLNGQARPAN